MSNISIAEVRRRLPVDQEFIAEYIGINSKFCQEGTKKTRRKVVKNTLTQIVSVFLEGPKINQTVWLDWKSLKAVQRDNEIILSFNNEEFLKILGI